MQTIMALTKSDTRCWGISDDGPVAQTCALNRPVFIPALNQTRPLLLTITIASDDKISTSMYTEGYSGGNETNRKPVWTEVKQAYQISMQEQLLIEGSAIAETEKYAVISAVIGKHHQVFGNDILWALGDFDLVFVNSVDCYAERKGITLHYSEPHCTKTTGCRQTFHPAPRSARPFFTKLGWAIWYLGVTFWTLFWMSLSVHLQVFGFYYFFIEYVLVINTSSLSSQSSLPGSRSYGCGSSTGPQR